MIDLSLDDLLHSFLLDSFYESSISSSYIKRQYIEYSRGDQMPKYKKPLAFLFGAIAMISYLSIRYFPRTEDTQTVLSVQDESTHMQVYLKDHDHSLVPLSIPVSEEMNEEDKLQLMVSYMSGKQNIKGFLPLFTKECTVKKVMIANGKAVMDFDDSLKNYQKEDELRVLESLTWGATQFHDVEQLEIQLNGVKLSSMPNAQTPIPDVLNRGIGINHFETATSALHTSDSVTVYCAKKIEGQQFLIPRSKRVMHASDSIKEGVLQVISDVSASSELSQPLYQDDVKINNFQFSNGTLIVDINKNLLSSDKSVKEDLYDSLILSLSALSGVDKVHVKVDGVSVMPQQQESAVSVYDLSYNEIAF